MKMKNIQLANFDVKLCTGDKVDMFFIFIHFVYNNNLKGAKLSKYCRQMYIHPETREGKNFRNDPGE